MGKGSRPVGKNDKKSEKNSEVGGSSPNKKNIGVCFVFLCCSFVHISPKKLNMKWVGEFQPILDFFNFFQLDKTL